MRAAATDERLPFKRVAAHTAGIEGYTVWSNLYLSGGVLIAATETQDQAEALPKPKGIMSDSKAPHNHDPAGSDMWSTIAGVDLVRNDFGNKAIRLPGITVS